MRVASLTVVAALFAITATLWIWLFAISGTGSWAGIGLGPLAAISSLITATVGGFVSAILYSGGSGRQATYALALAAMSAGPLAIGFGAEFWSDYRKELKQERAIDDVRQALANSLKAGLTKQIAAELDRAWYLDSVKVCLGEFEVYLNLAAESGEALWAYRMAFCQFHGAIGTVDTDAARCAKRMAETERWLPQATKQKEALAHRSDHEQLQDLLHYAPRYRKECEARLRGVSMEDASKWRHDVNRGE